MKPSKVINKFDLWLIIGLVCVSAVFTAAFLIQSRTGSEFAINFNGAEVFRGKLDENTLFSVPGKPNVVFETHDGAVAFVKSDCPDQICVHTGFISNELEFAACLPNKLILRIVNSR